MHPKDHEDHETNAQTRKARKAPPEFTRLSCHEKASAIGTKSRSVTLNNKISDTDGRNSIDLG
jgi:hypothetical protein